MKNRPWPIVILGTMLLIFPFFNVLSNYIFFGNGQSIQAFVQVIVSEKTPFGIFESFLMFPLAGLCVLAMKRWSYWALIVVSAWTMGRNFQIWMDNPEAISMTMLMWFNGANFALVLYYLLPSVRRVYFDSKTRWWERSPRYVTFMDAKIKTRGGALPCQIVNLSQGGALIKTGFQLQNISFFDLAFLMNGREVTLPCSVVHRGEESTGVEFQLKRGQNTIVKEVTRWLRKTGAGVTNEPDSALKSFGTWMVDLVQFRGFTPNIRN